MATIKESMIYREMELEKSAEWFHYTHDKFISHVDTMYYNVKAVGDWGLNLGSRTLIQTLKTAKEEAGKSGGPVPFMQEDDLCNDTEVTTYGSRMYRYCISKPDCFDIFVAETVPNLETPEIHVQLRSQFIWLNGLRDAFYESLVYLETVLDRYGIQISNIKENRLDIAWHTNYIQDMLLFFKDEYLGQMQVSSFKRWGKEGNFLGDEIYTDYISLGRRKSDSSFVRIYNKSKEVVEMGYKQFFVPIWREKGLISAFDQYVFNQIFEHGKCSWNYKETARCLFYLEYGRDDEIKTDIRQLLQFEDSSVDDYKRIADKCVPDLTDVVNIEIQVMRKYTKSFLFPPVEYPRALEPMEENQQSWVPHYEHRMYKILHMPQSIRDFITYDTIRFVKFKGEFAKLRRERRPTADWWNRLSACGELDGIHYDLCREYQKRYDLQRSKSRTLANLATLSSLYGLYGGYGLDDFDFKSDMADIVSRLNDNDRERYNHWRGKRQKELKNKFRMEPEEKAAERFIERDDTNGEIANLFDLCRI